MNHLKKFTPNLAELTKPLRDLSSKDAHWCWEELQKTAFVKIKETLTKSPIVALFDPGRETVVSADELSYDLVKDSQIILLDSHSTSKQTRNLWSPY